MWKKNYSRREFVKKNSLTGLGALVAMGVTPSMFAGFAKNADVPAILGGSARKNQGLAQLAGMGFGD